MVFIFLAYFTKQLEVYWKTGAPGDFDNFLPGSLPFGVGGRRWTLKPVAWFPHLENEHSVTNFIGFRVFTRRWRICATCMIVGSIFFPIFLSMDNCEPPNYFLLCDISQEPLSGHESGNFLFQRENFLSHHIICFDLGILNLSQTWNMGLPPSPHNGSVRFIDLLL